LERGLLFLDENVPHSTRRGRAVVPYENREREEVWIPFDFKETVRGKKSGAR